MTEQLGTPLVRLRQRKGYTQLRVAEGLCAASGKATVTRNEVSRWERPERIPSVFLARVVGRGAEGASGGAGGCGGGDEEGGAGLGTGATLLGERSRSAGQERSEGGATVEPRAAGGVGGHLTSKGRRW